MMYAGLKVESGATELNYGCTKEGRHEDMFKLKKKSENTVAIFGQVNNNLKH